MIETRGAQPFATCWVSSLSCRAAPPVGREVFGMQTKRTIDGRPTLRSPDSTLMLPAVAQRSARRATARRAGDRRATARQHKDDVEGRIVEYLKDHPQSTTGDIAKGLNANRGTVAAGLSHIVRAGDVTKGQAPD